MSLYNTRETDVWTNVCRNVICSCPTQIWEQREPNIQMCVFTNVLNMRVCVSVSPVCGLCWPAVRCCVGDWWPTRQPQSGDRNQSGPGSPGEKSPTIQGDQSQRTGSITGCQVWVQSTSHRDNVKSCVDVIFGGALRDPATPSTWGKQIVWILWYTIHYFVQL